jgi:hypothetical protein
MALTQPHRKPVTEVHGREITGSLERSNKVVPATIVMTPWGQTSVVIHLTILVRVDTE